MRFSLFSFLFLVSLLGIMASCHGAKQTTTTKTNPNGPLAITQQDTGKTYTVKVNDEFTVSFGECIGCAEVWKVADMDAQKITKLTNTYSGNKCKNCVGGSQINTFHFKVIAPGPSNLLFTYFGQRFLVTIVGN